MVSSSSPECVLPEPPARFPGLRLIRAGDDGADDMDSDWDEAPPLMAPRSQSPDIPLCAPIPIRLAAPLVPPAPDQDHPNQGLAREQQALKARFGLSPAASLKDSSTAANVTVTLTLNASAAEDVTQVQTPQQDSFKNPSGILQESFRNPSRILHKSLDLDWIKEIMMIFLTLVTI